MLAAIAECEHDLIAERTHDGLAAARACGRKGGPKLTMTPNKIAQARAMYDGGKHTVQEIADTFGVSRPTVYRHLTDRGAAGDRAGAVARGAVMVSARLTPEAKAGLVRQHLDDGVPLTRLAAAAGLPARTLRRRAASYRTDPNTAALQRQARRDLAGGRDLPAPSYSTIRSVVAAIDPGLRTLAHDGDAAHRHSMGVILIGMPGIEKRLARYPQLYSRIGFAHECLPLTTEELTAVLARRWHTDGLASSSDEFTESVAIAAIARITGGKLRLVDRLLSQVQHIQRINHLDTVTPEVVEAAREAQAVPVVVG